MRCLYIVPHDPVTPNFVGGTSARYYDQLLALSELGHEVHLWHFASPKRRELFHRVVETEPAIWETIQKRCQSIQLTEQFEAETVISRGLRRMRSLLPPRLPVSRWHLYRELQKLKDQIHPDVIWAQHIEPAMLAAQHSDAPVVYVHHDWLYRVKAMRSHREINPQQRTSEERLVRSVAAVISGSAHECEEIKAAGAHSVHYIPPSFEPVRFEKDRRATEDVRLVHLGGMGATANREGLMAYFKSVWPRLKGLDLQFDIVGDTSTAPPELQDQLRTVTCTGFVQDLTSVLRPYDLHVIPWEYSTGVRTRLPVAFNHAQVVVATRASVACCPEARDQENCRLVDRLEDMVPVITELAADHGQRSRLGCAARATFEKQFTLAALLPRYAAVLNGIYSK